jgi:C-terminal peptidase prc
MPAKLREFGKTKEEKQQIHFVLGGRANHYVLTHNPKVKAQVEERVAKFQEMVKGGKVPAKFLEEGKQLLARMPRLEAQRSLRKSYEQMVEGKMSPEQFQTSRTTILQGTVLSEEDAFRYAGKVMSAIRMVEDGYVKKMSAGEMVGWAVTGLYRRTDEKVPEDVQAKLKNAKDLPRSQLVELLARARQYLGKREDLDNQKDLNITLQRMLAHLDPYSTYIDPETLEKFRLDVTGTFTGIGIQIRKDSATDLLLVVSPIKGSPAYRAMPTGNVPAGIGRGLQAGDLITEIVREMDSKGNPLNPVEVTPTKGLMISDAVKKILGQPNTRVSLMVKREGVEKPLRFDITRGRIEVETVLGANRKADDDWNYWIDEKNRIGYIRLTQFSRNSFRDMAQVMAALTRQGVRGFILDLRFNPGGLLDSAVNIADLFLNEGVKIVGVQQPRFGETNWSYSERKRATVTVPMVCLVNGYSASGSEIVAAALKDNDRAVIIGERSYGKGSVQNIREFENGEIKMTTATFCGPHERNLNKASVENVTKLSPEELEKKDWGVSPSKPEFTVKLTRSEREKLADYQHKLEIIQPAGKKPNEPASDFKDEQLGKAVEYLRKKLATNPLPDGNKAG